MSSSRNATKVGIFVFISLLLLIGLILAFGKGLSPFHPTYTLYLNTPNVQGIKEQAQVLIAGYRVGSVTEISLVNGGKTARLTIRVDRRYPLSENARFIIEQSGFLGDQHVAIYPSNSRESAPLLKDGAEVRCEEPFNLQEAARAATGFINRVEQTAQEIREAVRRIDQMVLSEANLSAIGQSMSNLHLLSVKAIGVVDRVDAMVATNTQPVNVAVSNLLLFANGMERLGETLNVTVTENRKSLNATLMHAEAATKSIEILTQDLNNGKGVAGALLNDADIREALRKAIFTFSLFSSNLNRDGIFYKQRSPRPAPASEKSGTKGGGKMLP